MSDAHPPAPAKGGGDKAGGGGINLGVAWGLAILVIVVIMSGVISAFAGQLNTLLQVFKLNAGVFGAIAVVALLYKALS